MSAITETVPESKIMLWTGRVISTLPVLALTMSAVMKFAKPPMFVEGFGKLGFPAGVATGLGIVELVCTALYVIPRTSVLGAILLTGFLGGATAAHLRIGEPFIPPVIVGVLAWLGLYLRDRRLRELLPWKS